MESKEYTELVDMLEEWHENVISELCADDRMTCNYLCGFADDCIVIRAINAIIDLQFRLSRYEQAEKEGRILPCKAGEEVWEIEDDCNFGYDCHKTQTCYGCEYQEVSISPTRFTLAMVNQLGKTVFLSREEAAAALEERENEEL